MTPRLLVITGTSGVGKTTMSLKLESSFGFRKTAATDTVREVLRTQFSISEIPALHRSSFQKAGGNAIEDWQGTVDVVSEGVQAVIDRALRKGRDLLIEGVHFIPNRHVIDAWRDSGGSATGVVLFVDNKDRHREMIAKREKHNGKKVRHYLENFERIRKIQKKMIESGLESDWILMDPTKEIDPAGIISVGMD